MMKNITAFFILALMLTACGPSSEQVQKAIESTQVAAAEATTKVPTATVEPTKTSAPTATKTIKPTATSTKTPKPLPTDTPAKSPDEMRKDLEEVFTIILEEVDENVDTVNLVRVSEGLIEIEFKTVWASQDRQPQVTFDFLQEIADFFTSDTNENIVAAYGGNTVIVQVTTYSDSGDYRYQSETNHETMIKIAEKHITFDEWVIASNAGFK
jgi:hypothetical protein